MAGGGACGACAPALALRRVAASPATRAFVAVTVLLFLASAVATIACCMSMSAMGDMPMPGGWTASMVWQRMCGRTWPGTAASFLGMWLVMTVAMMLPSLAPMLWRYRRAVVATGGTRPDWLTLHVALGYFLWWSMLGAAVFPLGAALTAVAMRLPALGRVAPVAAAAVVTIAGALQFTRWKRRRLACCGETPGTCRPPRANVRSAWRHGLGLGMRCCAGPMAALLAIGVMELPAMAIVTAAISAERLARSGQRVARVVGAIGIGAGLLLMVRGAGAG